METLLSSLLALAPDVVIVDPPRAGLHPATLLTLLQGSAPHLLYVSCNPQALARDLAKLVAAYAIKRCAVVDLFPHTEHVETVVQLTRDKL